MDTILSLIYFGVLAAVGIAGYVISKNFVRRRLRFVDAIQSPLAPLAAGVLAFAVVLPLSFLPFISTTTAVLAGFATAFGTASGARALRRGEYIDRQLTS
jgi:hypothetical protein